MKSKTSNFFLRASLVLSLSLSINNSVAQVEPTTFNTHHITTKDGLTQNDILDIFQDSYGFVWITTNDGLNRYDGVEFKHFLKGNIGLESNLVLDICEDQSRNLWVSTADNGLFYYLRDENQFIHISQMSDDSRLEDLESVRYITMGEGNQLWFYARKSKSVIMIEYNPEELKVLSPTFFSIATHTYAQCSGLDFINGNLYISTYFGLLRYSNETKIIERLPNLDHTISDVEASQNGLYIATPIGLLSYDPISGDKEVAIDNLGNILKICWDGNDLYIAVPNGLYIASYSSELKAFNSPVIVESYPGFNTNVLSKINTGGVWAGLDKEAVKVYQHNTKPFNLIKGFGNNHIMPIFIDHNQCAWLGTEGSGYYHLTRDINKGDVQASYMDQSEVNAITYSDYISKYYLASNEGVFSQDANGVSSQISSITSVRSLIADQEYLWMGCYGEGLKRLNLETNEIYTFTYDNSELKGDIVRCIIKGKDGSLWISTSKGLFTIESDEKSAKQPKLTEVLPELCGSHYIVPLFESRSGDIWYGTLGDGLFKVDRSGGGYTLEEYNTNNLLPNNTIKAITEDQDGLIWVSLNGGVCAIDVEKGSSLSYNEDNGLQDSDLHELSVWHTADNYILFGGVKGLTVFNPRDIKISYTQGQPRLTDFKIFNKSINDIENRDDITPVSIEATKSIQLKYNQNSFSFLFSSFNYTGSKKQQYLYRLDGFDREWNVVKQGHSEASYTNIPSGNYRFRIQCKNEDGLLNPKELLVAVRIAPPIWLTWYAILIYFALVTAAFVTLIKFYQARLLRLNAVKLAKMEKKKVEELLMVRTNFFTNVSHEFRTPLTLILSPLQHLMADKELMDNKEWREHLRTMSFNGESLMRLVNDFLSFSKRENQSLKLDLQYGRLDLLIKQLSKNLEYMAKSKGVILNYIPASTGEVSFFFDAAHIEQIVYNLTSNAIKHTDPQEVVTLLVENNDDNVTIIVKDSGVGIPIDLQPHIFKRFVSRDSTASKESSGIGIGLSLTKDLVELHNGKITFDSKEDEGTTFVIVLPKSYGDDLVSNDPSSVEAISESIDGDNDSVEVVADSEQDVILIVDDSEPLLKLLTALFSSKYKVLTATDGLEGYKIAQSFIPNIIISDIMMPNMDGYEFCDKIKSTENTSHIPIILLTAKGSVSDMAKGYQHNADGYRVKPFNNDVLVEQVRSLLGNRRTLAARIKQNETTIDVEKIGISSDADKQMIKRLVGFVEENIGNPDLLVSDVCNAVGLTQVILNKKLKSLFNMTANAMIRTIRLKRAAELLRTGRYTVSSITYDVGFNDLRHFRESFLKEYGMFPQAYKKKYNEDSSSTEE